MYVATMKVTDKWNKCVNAQELQSKFENISSYMYEPV